MKIALVHSFYRSDQPSGENFVVLRQAQALQSAGHEVLLVARHTDDTSRGHLFSLRSAFTVATGLGPDPRKELQAFGPDIVHVHNLFPNFGMHWVREWAGPIVVTLHNFRTACSNALLFRDGAPCTLCPEGDRWAGVRHGCYRGSKVATLPLAIQNRVGPARIPLLERADRIIVLSERARRVFESSGLPSEKLSVIHNGLPDRPPARHDHPRKGWVFVGRLSPEKGILELLDEWPDHEELDIIGSGELSAVVESVVQEKVSVRSLGQMSNQDICDRLETYRGLLMSSLSFEGFPTVLAEALRAGTPVIAREGNSAADFIKAAGSDGVIGSVYSHRPSLLQALAAIGRREDLAPTCRAKYEESLSDSAWIRRQMDAYRSVS